MNGIGIILALVGISAIVFGVFQNIKRKKELADYTGYVEGKVINVEEKTLWSLNRHPEKRYYPTIEFTISDGDTVYPETIVTQYDPIRPTKRYVVNQIVYVRYNPKFYKDFYLAEDIKEANNSVLFLIAGFFIYIAINLMFAKS